MAMMVARPASTFIYTLCLLEMASAMTWSGPQLTPVGLMAMDGMSPRPTQAPGWDGLPGELRKRDYQYPPPLNWCGFVTGDYCMMQSEIGPNRELIEAVDNALTCSVGSTCLNSGTAVGCCTSPTALCDSFQTRCVNRALTSQCGADCTRDSRIVKW